jgi:hypothetical protein
MNTLVFNCWRSSLSSEFRIVGGHPTCLAAGANSSFSLSNNSHFESAPLGKLLSVRVRYTQAEPLPWAKVSSSTWETASFSGYGEVLSMHR